MKTQVLILLSMSYFTVTLTFAATPFCAYANTYVFPLLAPLTTPFALTDATFGFSDSYLIGRCLLTLPFLGFTSLALILNVFLTLIVFLFFLTLVLTLLSLVTLPPFVAT